MKRDSYGKLARNSGPLMARDRLEGTRLRSRQRLDSFLPPMELMKWLRSAGNAPPDCARQSSTRKSLEIRRLRLRKCGRGCPAGELFVATAFAPRRPSLANPSVLPEPSPLGSRLERPPDGRRPGLRRLNFFQQLLIYTYGAGRLTRPAS